MKLKKINFKKGNFSLEAPEMFYRIGGGCLFFLNYFNPHIGGSDELIGPNGASIKIVYGDIEPEPFWEDYISKLAEISAHHNHRVVTASPIEILGKKHATIVYDIPIKQYNELMVTRAKNYHLIFNGVEYVFTAKIAQLAALSPEMMTTNIGRYKQAWKQHKEMQKIQEIFGQIDTYDEIIKSFNFIK